MVVLFGVFGAGYFFNQLPLEQTVKTVGNVVLIILMLVLTFGVPHL